MKLSNRAYYISAYTSKQMMYENIQASSMLSKELKKAGYPDTELLCINGCIKVFHLVSADAALEPIIHEMAKRYNQEYIFIVYSEDQAVELLFADGSRKMIGYMKNLGPNEGQLNGRDYMYVNDNFYVITEK